MYSENGTLNVWTTFKIDKKNTILVCNVIEKFSGTSCGKILENSVRIMESVIKYPKTNAFFGYFLKGQIFVLLKTTKRNMSA